MKILVYILVSLALGILSMNTYRRSAEASEMTALKGLLTATIVALAATIAVVIGVAIGNLLASGHEATDTAVGLACLVVVALRLVIDALSSRKKTRPTYNLAKQATQWALAVATSINILLVGIGLGFTRNGVDMGKTILGFAVVTAITMFLLTYFGIMLGRQRTKVNDKHYPIVSLLLYLAAVMFEALA